MQRRTRRLVIVSTVLSTAALWTAQSPALSAPLSLVGQTISAAGDVSLWTSDDVTGPGDDINLAGTTITAGGALSVSAADSLAISADTTLTAESIELDTARNDSDGLGDIHVAGTFFSERVSATAGAGDNTISLEHPTVIDNGGSTSPNATVVVDGGDGTDLLDVDTTASTAFLSIGVGNVATGGQYTFADSPTVRFTDIEELTTTAELSVSVTDGQSVADAGARVHYSVVATNGGQVGLWPVTITDDLPSAITGVTWTCSASSGSWCAASGTGDLSSRARLAAGGSASYLISGTVSTSASGSIANSASVAPPVPVVDPAQADNTATDTTRVRAAQSIAFASLPDRDLSTAPFDVAATASSGLPVTLTASGSCSVSGSTVTLQTPGACTVTGTQPGNDAWAPAPPVTRTFQVTKVATALEVWPVLLSSSPLGLPFGTLSARLTTAQGPLAGQPVVFSAPGPVCTATTDSAGVAACPLSLPALLQVVLAGSVTAAFDGSPTYLPSSGTAPLVR